MGTSLGWLRCDEAESSERCGEEWPGGWEVEKLTVAVSWLKVRVLLLFWREKTGEEPPYPDSLEDWLSMDTSD